MAFATPELDAMISTGVSAIPTTPLWEEIKALLLANYGSAVGSVVLNSDTGVTATFADINSVDYDVYYHVEYDPLVAAGSTGEIRIERLGQTSFKVYNTGSDTTSVLFYRIQKR